MSMNTYSTDRNVVSRVLFKGGDQRFHHIFTVEGDKPMDPSLYIVKRTTINPEVDRFEEEVRAVSLQVSIHARKDDSGWVDTHFKRWNHRFGRQKRGPVGSNNAPVYYFSAPSGRAYDFDEVSPLNEDVVIAHKPQLFLDIGYIFHSGSSDLRGVLQRQGLFLIRTFDVPVRNVPRFCVSTVIKMKRLIELHGGSYED